MRRDEDNHIPDEFLVKHRSLLPAGRALDVAMGAGRNAVYLAKEGFQVEGIDIAEEAVDKALALAGTQGLKISTLIADLENGYRLPESAYDVVVCFYYLHRPLIPEIKKSLKPGGMIVYQTYNCDQAQFGRPTKPEHLLQHNELIRLFGDFFILRYFEGLVEPRKSIAGLIARKPQNTTE
jgi:SAM-dependent methyltransferase